MAEKESTSDDENCTTILLPDDRNEKYREILQQVKAGDAEAVFKQIPDKLKLLEENGDGEKKLYIFKAKSNDQAFFMCVPVDEYFELVSKLVWDKMGVNADRVTMEQRMKDAAPYNVFFNKLVHVPETDDQLYSIRFTDLLCPSLGKLKSSFHITYMADIFWILRQYAARKLHKLPMTIIHGYKKFEWPKPETMKKLYPDIDYYMNVLGEEEDFGCHHTKLSIFVYDDDSIRLVIGSANLYVNDWEIYNEQLWISPRCPKLPDGGSAFDGESPTGFKMFLLDYLCVYNDQNVESLGQWIDRVKATDFSDIKVALVYTVPGVHQPRKNGSLIHYLGHILSRDCVIPAPQKEHDSWCIVAQTASLGLIGKTPDEWLTTNFLKSLGSHKQSPYLPTLFKNSKILFNLVYPTMENCLDGHLKYRSAGCCRYTKNVKEAQPWLLKHKCLWKADGTKRSRVISHSKCYCRISPCWKKMSYYFLTSANLSRSAWGVKPNADSSIFVRSYEMGVLFLPKYFGEEYFETMEDPDRKNQKLFPIMFDLPLTPYGPEDESYCCEELIERLGLNDNDDKEKKIEAKNTDIENKEQSTRSLVEDEKFAKSQEKSTDKENQAAPAPVLSNKKDMKYMGKPVNNSFFPSFKKN
ncbi:unnamed protein product [Ceutorhynchus assimilis]|uniref:Tyrosyl-DNA phosphodiesterase n=1 Tax=Ceutorhynchus assimilis TaxID=467358 RepID=A0A9N9MI57_9CUCU|nr:unnamed protein product [Ceutorhynchus assimilis]CAG9764162.1 unnamed protein product [Ceutorhynchus assimilis]